MNRLYTSLLMVCVLFGCNYEVIEMPQDRELDPQQIEQKLKSDSFMEKLQARKQINKLKPKAKLKLMLVLLKSDDAPTRLIAVSELATLQQFPEAKAALQEASQSDRDETVREEAKGALSKPKTP